MNPRSTPGDAHPTERSINYSKTLSACYALVYSPRPFSIDDIRSLAPTVPLNQDAFVSLLRTVQTVHVKQSHSVLKTGMQNLLREYREVRREEGDAALEGVGWV